ncbi:hypothetical protein Bbelb_318410 [Branchiostoma belcheri]|nr:hypothetical protein Bbelb_318410 [Branchiostoma belcheri]
MPDCFQGTKIQSHESWTTLDYKESDTIETGTSAVEEDLEEEAGDSRKASLKAARGPLLSLGATVLFAVSSELTALSSIDGIPEKIGLIPICGILISIVGVILVSIGMAHQSVGSTNAMVVSITLPLAAAFSKGPDMVLCRAILKDMSGITMLLYITLVGTVAEIILTYSFEIPVWVMSAKTAWYIAGLGLCQAVAMLFFLGVLKVEKAAIAVALRALVIPLTILLDYLILSKVPNAIKWGGAISRFILAADSISDGRCSVPLKSLHIQAEEACSMYTDIPEFGTGITVVFWLAGLVIIICNAAVLWGIIRRPELRKQLHILMANLAVVDMLAVCHMAGKKCLIPTGSTGVPLVTPLLVVLNSAINPVASIIRTPDLRKSLRQDATAIYRALVTMVRGNRVNPLDEQTP